MYHTSLAYLLCLLLFPMLSMAQFTNCTLFPPHNVSSILDLRPRDIKVIMAMGDSFTTGFGVFATANDSRGQAFSMGGDAAAFTLPNLLQFFNITLRGASLGTYKPDVCYGSTCPIALYNPTQDAHNAAKSGAMVYDMVGRQFSYLARQLKQNPDIDIQLDWKLLTIMIGANDLCASCTYGLPYLEPDEYENNLMGVLERVRTGIPRTFVNLVPLFNLSGTYNLTLENQTRFENATRSLYIQCDCIFAPDAGDLRQAIDTRIQAFNQRMFKVASYYQRKAYDNFAVVVQPFASNTDISGLSPRFLSRLDGFHPSRFGHQTLATALWNSMLTPAANKKTFIDPNDTPICPTSDTLLYTY